MNDSPNKIPCSSSLHGYGRPPHIRNGNLSSLLNPFSFSFPPSGLIIMLPPREIENPLAIKDCWARGAGFIHPLLQGNFVKTVSISKCWANYVPRYAYGTYTVAKNSFQRRERRRRKRKRERRKGADKDIIWPICALPLSPPPFWAISSRGLSFSLSPPLFCRIFREETVERKGFFNSSKKLKFPSFLTLFSRNWHDFFFFSFLQRQFQIFVFFSFAAAGAAFKSQEKCQFRAPFKLGPIKRRSAAADAKRRFFSLSFLLGFGFILHKETLGGFEEEDYRLSRLVGWLVEGLKIAFFSSPPFFFFENAPN